MKDVYILAIESSCDETSMAIVKNGYSLEVHLEFLEKTYRSLI